MKPNKRNYSHQKSPTQKDLDDLRSEVEERPIIIRRIIIRRIIYK